jgi:TetR/AcrR family tetracycline transcriptional repressor
VDVNRPEAGRVALDRERIVAAAVALLDEGGLDGVTMRKLAARLGVRPPTLYWHVRNKAALINELADAILAAAFAGLEPPAKGEPWRGWLAGVAVRLRQAMLVHPDGARVVAAAHLSQRLADLSELAMASLVDGGVPLQEARLRVLSVERFTIGHVLEEQSPPPEPEVIEGFDHEAFTRSHPTAVAAIADYFQPGRTIDDLFRDCVELILR